MQKVTRNTFEKGINSDIDPTKLPPAVYTDAHNVELIGDGDFFALRNVKGTTLEESILTGTNVEVLGVFENSYKIGGANKKCLTIFTLQDAATLSSEPASFTISGIDANLSYSAIKTMTASPASFSVIPQTANLKTYRLTASNGNFNVFGESATLTAVTIINIELVVSTVYGSRFNVEFSGVNETKTINRTNSGTTTSTMKSSSSIAAKVTKGASGTETASELTSVEWLNNGDIKRSESIGSGNVVNITYSYTSVAQGNTLRVEVIEA